MVNVAHLSAGLRVRPATMNDLEAVFHVQIAQEVADLVNRSLSRTVCGLPGSRLALT